MARKQQVVSDFEGTVAVDLGNNLLKGVSGCLAISAVSMPHAVKELTPRQYEQHLNQLSGGFARNKGVTSTFQHGNSIYVVGQDADMLNDSTPKTGGAKYEKAYYVPLLLAQLLQLYPDGHDSLNLMVGCPPSDYLHRPTIRKSVIGKHTLTRTDGEKVTYAVKEARIYDEPIGGMLNFVMADDGVTYRASLDVQPDELGLVIDIGGKISSLVPVRSSGWVGYDAVNSFDIGITDVMDLAGELILSDKANRQYFKTWRGALPHDENLRNALITGVYHVAGHEVNVLAHTATASKSILEKIRGELLRYSGGASAFRYIILTGGGGAYFKTRLLEGPLSDFNQRRIYQSIEDISMMHFANVFGAMKFQRGMIIRGMKNGA